MQYKSHFTKPSCQVGSDYQGYVKSQKCLSAKYPDNFDGPYSSSVLKNFINAVYET
jgi:hypothetical protein